MWWLALALAQQAPAEPSAPEDPDASEPPPTEPPGELLEPPPDLEIVVEGELSVEGARAALDETIRDEGYLPGVDLGDRTFYYPKQFWKPRVTVYDEGYVRVKARVVSPFPCFPLVMIWAHPKVVDAQELRALEAVQPELSAYRRALIARGLALRKEELLAELTLLETLPPEQARQEAVGLWLSTADTPEGESVRRWIEDWYEDHLPPLSPEQVEAVNAARTFPRPWIPDQLGEYWFDDQPEPEFEFLDPEEEEFWEPEVEGEGLDRELQTLPAPVKKKGPLDRLNGGG